MRTRAASEAGGARRPGFSGYLRLLLLLTVSLVAPSLTLHAVAQDRESSLSDGEVDKLRETAISPPERVMAFVDFLNQRATRIEKLSTGPRKPGREEDIHDLLDQCASILDDLTDNLDDYGQRHRDVRKVLPKLIAASERWGTTFKSPPDHVAYSVSRKLALESLGELHDTATKMVEEQKTWFAAHPPGKEPAATRGI